MVRAILFDMGGTLDGDGVHWLDRFVALYRSAGVSLPRENLRSAFDVAEARAAGDPVIATAGLQSMIERHVDWQLEHLGIPDVSVRQQLISGFVAPVRDVAAANCRLLAELRSRGLLLAVVSNGCGNVDVLCRDYGYAPLLSAIVDSRRVGISKPDPAIFTRAAALLGAEPADTLVVGDSFERDIVPAKRAGMMTAWLQPDPARSAPDGSIVDVRLTRLADVAAWLAAPAPIA